MAGERRGLLVDWGGVLTSNVFESFAAFCRAEGLDPHAVGRLFRDDERARDSLVELESGRIDETEFELRLASVLEIDAHGGLVDRLFAAMRPDDAMVSAVHRAREQGVRTGLISNSWGVERYDRTMLDRLFDATVISAEEGTRKPDPRMYSLGAERIALPPTECVFVDDLPFNLPPAEQLGMATVLHRDAEQTIARLEELLGLGLH